MFLLNPLEQFEIKELLIFKIAGITFVNTNLYIVLGIITAITILRLPFKQKLISKRIVSNSVLYSSILKLVKDQIGQSKYIGIIYSIFTVILISNLIGLVPYSYTVTSQFVITLSMSIAIIIAVTVIGFTKHGIAYMSVLVPEGTPLILVPMVTLLESLSYIARAISLGVRLGANCLAGHTLLKVASTFSWELTTNMIVPLFCIPSLTALVGLELGIALLQAYVFTTLTCSYIRDSINLHH